MSNLDEVVTFPQLNRPAPNFNAKTTHRGGSGNLNNTYKW